MLSVYIFVYLQSACACNLSSSNADVYPFFVEQVAFPSSNF